jgi:hypothetical protein
MPATTKTGDRGDAVVSGVKDMLATTEDTHALTAIDHRVERAWTFESKAHNCL